MSDKLEPPLHWCFTHGRTLIECFEAGGTVLVDRECNSTRPPFMEKGEPSSTTTEK